MAAINHEIKQKDQVIREQLKQLPITKGLTAIDNAEELVQVRIMPYFDMYFQIGKSISVEDRLGILLSLV